MTFCLNIPAAIGWASFIASVFVLIGYVAGRSHGYDQGMDEAATRIRGLTSDVAGRIDRLSHRLQRHNQMVDKAMGGV